MTEVPKTNKGKISQLSAFASNSQAQHVDTFFKRNGGNDLTGKTS